jgi:hypothetical protein
MDEIRLYFEQNGAVTRYLRRKYLYLLKNRMVAAAWLSAHPGDLWDTDEEERRRWTHMHADHHVELVEQHHAITGLYEEPDDIDDHEDVILSTRAQVVGLTRARQERLFEPEWVVGNGVWEKKK